MLSVKLKINPSGVRRILEERALLMNMVENWSIDELISWLKSNEQASQEDNAKGLGVYFVNDWSQQISAETALEKIGIIPDYKNNKQLLVLDFSKVVYQLSKFESINITQLVNDLLTQKGNESTKFNEEEFKANPVGKFKDLLKEQASKQLGVKTTDALTYLIENGWKKISKS